MRSWKCTVVVGMLLLGCGDETTINNYYSFTNGAISGRVTPNDPGTMVMTADSVKVRYTDANGFFILDSLTTGMYNIVIRPVHFSRRELREVTVAAGQVVSLGNVELSTYPYPFFQSRPANGEDSVRIGSSISLLADGSVMFDDLARLAAITPSLAGDWAEWIGSKSSRTAQYSFRPSEPMRAGTTYHLMIPASVRTEDGSTLGSDLSLTFTTESLRFSMSRLGEGILGGVSLWGFNPSLWFNADVDADSLTKAISFTPGIEGLWVAAGNNPGSSYFSFLALSGVPLLPQTEYRMILSDAVALADSLRLPRPDTIRFTTEPYGVMDAYPRNGMRTYSPLSSITLIFNTPMDSVSVRTAFSLHVEGLDTLITGSFRWSMGLRRMSFDVDGGLLSRAIYRYTLSRAAHTMSGEQLSQDFTAIFLVEDSPWLGKQNSRGASVFDDDYISRSAAVVPH